LLTLTVNSRPVKSLYIVRHAKAEPLDTLYGDDFERALADKGKQHAVDLGLFLRESVNFPEHVIASPSKRTRSTARRIMKALGRDEKEIEYAESIYESGLQSLIYLIASQSNQHRSLMIVGHNPGMHSLVNYFNQMQLLHFPTCGCVKINFEIERWSDIERAIGKIEFTHWPD
jgi:phosphohistidine phosphatase